MSRHVAGTLTPACLKCEYLDNPLGLDIHRPRLSWELYSDRRGEHQTAYQVVAATSPELLKDDMEDLWNSGKVTSGQSIHVEYAGAPMQSGMRCYWKARVWDMDGNPGPYSDVNWWEMGLLEESEWQGRWIGGTPQNIPEGKTSAPSPMFRQTFTLDQPVVSARAYICGLGYYELYLNGSKSGDHVLDPLVTRYDRRALYVTHDITDMLVPGENAVGVMLGNGWYNAHTKVDWNFQTASWRALPKMMMQIHLVLADGSHRRIVSDGGWRTSTGPLVFDALRNGEIYDARLEMPGWLLPGYDDTSWNPALVVPGPGGVLSAQQAVPCKVMETIKPVSVIEVKPGVFVYDMGRNFAGWAQLSVSGPSGTEVTLRYSENITSEGEIDQSNIAACGVRGGDIQTDRYILKGEVTEVWEPGFTYHGFQYVEVTGFPGTPTLDNLRGRMVNSAFEFAGKITCSSELLNSMQECTLQAYASNFMGIPTDCPHREKNGWTGDAMLAAETGLFNFTAQSAYTKWMTDFADEQRPSGQLPGIVPTGGWGYNWGSGPAWDSAYTHIPWYMYLYSGDARILETHYSGMKRYVSYMTSMATGNILYFGLGDWCPPQPRTNKNTPPAALTSTGYYYANCRILAQAAELLGYLEDLEFYSELARQIKDSFNAKFYNPENGRYADGGQTAQACALFHGMVEPEEREKVLARLKESIVEKDNHPWFGILGAKYVPNVLTDEGYADLALTMLTQTTYPSWGYWIEQGATTLWETWEGESSRNHIMFGDVSAWMYKTLAGISPDASMPGFRHFTIRPRVLSGLTWVEADHKSMYGPIRSGWRITENSILFDIDIPVSTFATVYLPAKDLQTVTEGGYPVDRAEGVRVSMAENGSTALDVSSGKYCFIVQVSDCR